MADTVYGGRGRRIGRGVPDLVDEADISARLRANRRDLGRMRRRGVMPEPTFYFKGHSIWLWETIERWARRSERSLRRLVAAGPTVLDVVGVDDIASRLGVEPRIAANWHATGALPDPDYRWEAGAAWRWGTIERWTHGRGRAVSPIVRRRSESVRVQPRVERPLVSGPIGGTKKKEPKKRSGDTG